MNDEIKNELKAMLQEAFAAVESNDKETAKEKIKKAEDKIENLPPAGGTGSNGLMPK